MRTCFSIIPGRAQLRSALRAGHVPQTPHANVIVVYRDVTVYCNGTYTMRMRMCTYTCARIAD